MTDTANIDAPSTAAILKGLVRRFRQAWPEVRILVRADSGFCRRRFMRWCDRRGVDYLPGLARNDRVAALAAPLAEEASRRFEATGAMQRLFGEVRYGAETRDRPRRVLDRLRRLPGLTPRPRAATAHPAPGFH